MSGGQNRNRRFAPIMVHPERVEKHILEDEHESHEYIKQLWAEMMDFYYKRSWKRNILVVFGLCKQSKQEKIKRQKVENIVNALCKQEQIFRKNEVNDNGRIQH